MARRPLPDRNKPRLHTLAATRDFIRKNAGLRGLKLHIAEADGLASAAEMSRLLDLHDARRGWGWNIGNRKLLNAGAALHGSLMDARHRVRRFAHAVGRRFACAFREPHRLLPGAKMIDDDAAAALRVIRDESTGP